MIAYFDSSALVKLLVDEPGSDDVAAFWDGADAVVASQVTHPEVCAAVAAAARGGRIAEQDHVRAMQAWDGYRQGLRLVELTSDIEQHAGALAARHALGGVDAIHLASALRLGLDVAVMATWNRRLHAGAGAAGLGTLPAVLPAT